MSWHAVIGLEIHVELSTASKMFCSCSALYFGTKPNTHTCPVCLGLPGALPRANKKAIEFTQLFAQSVNCKLPLSSKFDRKNYFYPDLSKGYQISQYDLPFSQNGSIEIKSGSTHKTITITRAHLEEDTGKLTHTMIDGKRVTLIDFNRSGVPLMEIVSEPQISSAQEAKDYAQKIQQIVRYLQISDADMEKGSMRIEPNISLRKENDKKLPNYKVELKNINSFKFVQHAIEYEIKRQSELLNSGQTPNQETRGWNEFKNETFSQRAKEVAYDYRYFPEPDIPPFSFTQEYMDELKSNNIEMPSVKRKRFLKEYGLDEYDCEILTRDRIIADYFELAAKVAVEYKINPKQIANYLIHQKININKVLPAALVKQIVSKSKTAAINEQDLKQIIADVLKNNPKAVSDYKNGKVNVTMFLVGTVMSNIKDKPDPQIVKKMIEITLNS